MELCWSSKKKVLERNVACLWFCILGMIIIIDTILANSVDLSKGHFSAIEAINIMVAIAFIVGAVFYYMIESRAYKVDIEGITLCYLKKIYVKHLWDDISEISVCDVHHATKGPAFDMIIRVVIGDEKNGPSNQRCSINPFSGREHWRSDVYDLKHFRQVVTIEYEKQRLQQIKQMSNKEIKDYRTRRGKEQEVEI